MKRNPRKTKPQTFRESRGIKYNAELNQDRDPLPLNMELRSLSGYKFAFDFVDDFLAYIGTEKNKKSIVEVNEELRRRALNSKIYRNNEEPSPIKARALPSIGELRIRL